MRGLIEKDLRLISKRKTFLVLILAILVFVGMYMEASFLMFYVPLMVSLFTITTISYDEFDNGMSFIMTLPIRAKDYAIEKYLLGAGLGVLGWIIASIITLFISKYKGESISAADTLVVIPTFLLIMAVMIPIELKFGSEKSRIAMMVIGGGCLVVGFLGKSLLEKIGIDTSFVENSLNSEIKLSESLIFIVIAVVLYLISMLISIAIMNKKEY